MSKGTNMKKETCLDWTCLNPETDESYIYYCDKCGRIKIETGYLIAGPATAVDQDTLYCIEYGFRP